MNEPTTKKEAIFLISSIADKFGIKYKLLDYSKNKLNTSQYIISAPKFIEKMTSYLPRSTWDSTYDNADWETFFNIANQYNKTNICRVIKNLRHYGWFTYDKSQSDIVKGGVVYHAMNLIPSFYPILVYDE